MRYTLYYCQEIKSDNIAYTFLAATQTFLDNYPGICQAVTARSYSSDALPHKNLIEIYKNTVAQVVVGKM